MLPEPLTNRCSDVLRCVSCALRLIRAIYRNQLLQLGQAAAQPWLGLLGIPSILQTASSRRPQLFVFRRRDTPPAADT